MYVESPTWRWQVYWINGGRLSRRRHSRINGESGTCCNHMYICQYIMNPERFSLAFLASGEDCPTFPSGSLALLVPHFAQRFELRCSSRRSWIPDRRPAGLMAPALGIFPVALKAVSTPGSCFKK